MERLTDLIDQIRSLLASTPQIVAAGECGIDKVRNSTSFTEQRTWLEAQMHLACQLHRPIPLHTTRAWNETIGVRKELAQEFDPLPPMVLHGFQAKGEVVHMMLSRGFALSSGRHYNPTALRLAYEAYALLIKTDELPQGLTHQKALVETYTHSAEALTITPEALTECAAATPLWQQVEWLDSLC